MNSSVIKGNTFRRYHTKFGKEIRALVLICSAILFCLFTYVGLAFSKGLVVPVLGYCSIATYLFQVLLFSKEAKIDRQQGAIEITISYKIFQSKKSYELRNIESVIVYSPNSQGSAYGRGPKVIGLNSIGSKPKKISLAGGFPSTSVNTEAQELSNFLGLPLVSA